MSKTFFEHPKSFWTSNFTFFGCYHGYRPRKQEPDHQRPQRCSSPAKEFRLQLGNCIPIEKMKPETIVFLDSKTAVSESETILSESETIVSGSETAVSESETAVSKSEMTVLASEPAVSESETAGVSKSETTGSDCEITLSDYEMAILDSNPGVMFLP